MPFYNVEVHEKLHSHVSFCTPTKIYMTTLNDNLQVLLRDLKCKLLYIYQNENCLNESCRGELNTNFIFNTIFTSLAVLMTIYKKKRHLSYLCSKHTEI
jgi:hypothetical protein